MLVAGLDDVVRNDPGFVTLLFELFVLSRRHADVAAEFGALLARLREQLAAVLRAKQDEGVLVLAPRPTRSPTSIFSLGDGMMLRMLADGERDFAPGDRRRRALRARARARRGVRTLMRALQRSSMPA